jgi:hypothetical protein
MLGLANLFGPDDEASVQVSNNGTTWTTVWSTRAWVRKSSWQYCEYDISAVADSQPAVYVRWVMGPTDDGCGCYGWNIDDVQITAKTMRPPIHVLAWVPYTDPTQEYPNAISAAGSASWPVVVTESWTFDPAVLEQELEGKQVFFVPEPEAATSADLVAAGAAFAGVLQDFAYEGGTVIVSGEVVDGMWDWGGFMNASGLMAVTQQGFTPDGGTLTVSGTDHFIASNLLGTSLNPTFAAPDSTAAYTQTGIDADRR